MSAPDYKDDLVFPPQPEDSNDKGLCWTFAAMMILTIITNLVTILSNSQVVTAINEPNVVVSKCDMVTLYTNCEEGDKECFNDLLEDYGDD